MTQFKNIYDDVNSFISSDSDILTIISKYNYNLIKVIVNKYKCKIVAENDEEKDILKSLTQDIVTIKNFIDVLLSKKLNEYNKKIVLITEYDERLINIKMLISIISRYKLEEIKLPKIILLSHNEKFTLGQAIKLNFHKFESKKQTFNISKIIDKVNSLKESGKNIVLFVDDIRSYVGRFKKVDKINIISNIEDKLLDNITNLFILTWNTKYLIRDTVITYIIDILFEKNKGDYIYTSRIISEEKMNHHADFINIIEPGIHYINDIVSTFFDKEEPDEKYNKNITQYIRKLISYNFNPTNKELFGEDCMKYINNMIKMEVSLYETNDYYNRDLSLISAYLLTNYKSSYNKNLLLLLAILENDTKYIIKNKDIFRSQIREINDLGDDVNDLELLITILKGILNNNLPSDIREYVKMTEIEKILNTYYAISDHLNIKIRDDLDSVSEFINKIRELILPYFKVVQLTEKNIYVDDDRGIYKLQNDIIINKYRKQPRFLLILKEHRNIIKLSIDIEEKDYIPQNIVDKFMYDNIPQINKDRLRESINMFWELKETDEKDISKLSQEDQYKFLETRNYLMYSLPLSRDEPKKIDIPLTQEERLHLETLLTKI